MWKISKIYQHFVDNSENYQNKNIIDVYKKKILVGKEIYEKNFFIKLKKREKIILKLFRLSQSLKGGNMIEMKYRIIKNIDFIFNNFLFNHIYSPIIKNDAVLLYNFLITDYDVSNKINISINKISDLNKFLNFTENQFSTSKKILEAMGLISSYIDTTKYDTYHIKINNFKTWNDFKKDPKKLLLLKNAVGSSNFDKVKYAFEKNDFHLSLLTNVNSTFESVFGNLDINNINNVDFNHIYDSLLKMTNKLIVISDEDKKIIEYNFRTYDLTYNEIIKVIHSSIFFDSKQYLIDKYQLNNNFLSLIEPSSQLKINTIVAINRNSKIFNESFDLKGSEHILEDYKKYNSEQYLSLLQKQAIDQSDKLIINSLRKKFNLPDYLINVLLDFVIYKNKGKIIFDYIAKIANTINRLNITTVEETVKHLNLSMLSQNNNISIKINNELDWD